MNDRHRTLERYRKRYGRRDPFPLTLYCNVNQQAVKTIKKVAESIGPALKQFCDTIRDTLQRVADAINDFAESIRAMSEEEFQEKMCEWEKEFTPEQVEIIKKIRGDVSNERPNNPTKSMGE